MRASVLPGEDVTGMIIFKGCTVAPDGRCNVDVVFKVLSPDGPALNAGQSSLWASAPLDGLLMLGSASATLRFKTEDTPGTYCIVAKIDDRNAATSLELRTVVILRTSRNSP
jgi:hypothetical protein